MFSRIHLNVRQITAVAAFLVVASMTQMCIPALLSVMIDKGVWQRWHGNGRRHRGRHGRAGYGQLRYGRGQRQLLTIARAIVADPEIMILDEATSHLDAHTEIVIQEAMATLMRGHISFVIAHRLSTIRAAAVILYMENGDIKEVGDHHTLMARAGKYAVLCNSQFG